VEVFGRACRRVLEFMLQEPHPQPHPQLQQNQPAVHVGGNVNIINIHTPIQPAHPAYRNGSALVRQRFAVGLRPGAPVQREETPPPILSPPHLRQSTPRMDSPHRNENIPQTPSTYFPTPLSAHQIDEDYIPPRHLRMEPAPLRRSRRMLAGQNPVHLAFPPVRDPPDQEIVWEEN
jgi:hypothetical protein